jgi:formate dehydrogenase subunit delta
MDAATTVRMANQIASFFKSYPHDVARKETAEHINRFWEPRMREAFFDHLSHGGAGFDPLVIEASSLVRRPKPSVGAGTPGS